MSTLSATPITPAATAATAWDYSAPAPLPSLAVIDAAIMRAVVAGDIERRDALMATRAAVALAEILGTLPATDETETDSATGAEEEDAHDDDGDHA